MKVLSFSYCFPSQARPSWGVFVLQRLAALARQPEVELRVVAPVPVFPVWSRWRGPLPDPYERPSGLTVHRPRFFYVPGALKWLDGPLYGRGLRRWFEEFARKWQPDVLDAHFVWPDGVGVARLARDVGLPLTITLRGWLYEAMRYPRILRQCVTAMHQASAIISVSTHLAETAAELGVPSGKIHVIANGVDTDRFFPRDKIDARRQLGLPTDGRLLVTVAHLGPRKGHHEVLRALAGLPDDVRLVLVGSDVRGRGRNATALRQMIHRLQMDDRAILVGQQPYDRVPAYFNAADISVLASYREGCPNVVLESLASGTPVVASRVGGVSDMIEDGCNGRIVPPRQAEPLARAIRQLLDDPPSERQVRCSSAVRSWNEVAGDVRDVLGHVAQANKSRGRTAGPAGGFDRRPEGNRDGTPHTRRALHAGGP